MRWGRAIGAVLLFLLVFGLGDLLVRRVLQQLIGGFDAGWGAAGRGLIRLALPSMLVLVAMYALLLRWLDRDPAAMGLPPLRAWGRPLGIGLAWGGGLAAAALGLVLVGGARIVTGPGFMGERFGLAAGAVLVGLALFALIEELVFRGWPLARLARAAGPVTASIVLTVAFVALHLPNPDVTALGLLNIGLAGLTLSAVFFAGGGLPAAWALHLGWNAGIALGADAPVSGLRFGLPVVEYVPGGHGLWDGGAFGPEGGFAATLVLGVAAIYWMRRLVRAPVEQGETA